MGDEIELGAVSVAPRIGVGLLTDGELANFKGPFPQGETTLAGGEVSFQIDKYKPIGKAALIYYWGSSSDEFTQDDLPLGADPLLSLIKFKSERESNSHFVLGEWRWATEIPVFETPHWSLVRPEVGVGLGVYNISTVITQEGAAAEESLYQFVATGSGGMELVGFRYDQFQIGLNGGVRIFAGQSFGIMAESSLTLGWIK